MSDRLRVYEERSSLPLLVLAVVFLVVYAAPVIYPSLSPGVITFLNVCSGVIWLVLRPRGRLLPPEATASR